MSDFFSNLYGGIRQPDVVMNGGPLPPKSTAGSGYPAGFNGTPDGRINYASSLLGNVDPYAYGEADRLSTQTAYLNIPHRTQRIIPSLNLPEAQLWNAGGSFFTLSHQVDDGDIAFVIRAMFSPYELVADKKKYNRQGILYAVDPVVNLATANYILHGLQRFGFDKENVSWHTLWQALGIDQHFARKYPEKLSVVMMHWENIVLEAGIDAASTGSDAFMWKMLAVSYVRHLRRELVDYLVKNIIRPFGVPTGSERQGGQHQGSNSAITWPVDFVTTLTIDGLVINLVNFWRHEDVNSGDDLMLYVEDRPYTEYVLSHHPKNVKKQVFPRLRAWEMPATLARLHAESDSPPSNENVAVALDRFLEMFFNATQRHAYDASLQATGPAGMQPGAGNVENLFMGSDAFTALSAGFANADAAGGSRKRGIDFASIADSSESNRKGWMQQQKADPRNPCYIPDQGNIRCSPGNAATYFEQMKEIFAVVVSRAKNPNQPANLKSTAPAHLEPLVNACSAVYSRLVQVLKASGQMDESNDHRIDALRKYITVKESVYQLVPGISSSACTGVREAVWRHGYWHIARSQVMHFKYDQHLDIPNGIHAAVRGKVLQVTFAPVWAEPLEDSVMGGAGVNVACTMSRDLGDNSTVPRKRIRFSGPSGGSSGSTAAASAASATNTQQQQQRSRTQPSIPQYQQQGSNTQQPQQTHHHQQQQSHAMINGAFPKMQGFPEVNANSAIVSASVARCSGIHRSFMDGNIHAVNDVKNNVEEIQEHAAIMQGSIERVRLAAGNNQALTARLQQLEQASIEPHAAPAAFVLEAGLLQERYFAQQPEQSALYRQVLQELFPLAQQLDGDTYRSLQSVIDMQIQQEEQVSSRCFAQLILPAMATAAVRWAQGQGSHVLLDANSLGSLWDAVQDRHDAIYPQNAINSLLLLSACLAVHATAPAEDGDAMQQMVRYLQGSLSGEDLLQDPSSSNAYATYAKSCIGIAVEAVQGSDDTHILLRMAGAFAGTVLGMHVMHENVPSSLAESSLLMTFAGERMMATMASATAGAMNHLYLLARLVLFQILGCNVHAMGYSIDNDNATNLVRAINGINIQQPLPNQLQVGQLAKSWDENAVEDVTVEVREEWGQLLQQVLGGQLNLTAQSAPALAQGIVRAAAKLPGDGEAGGGDQQLVFYMRVMHMDTLAAEDQFIHLSRRHWMQRRENAWALGPMLTLESLRGDKLSAFAGNQMRGPFVRHYHVALRSRIQRYRDEFIRDHGGEFRPGMLDRLGSGENSVHIMKNLVFPCMLMTAMRTALLKSPLGDGENFVPSARANIFTLVEDLVLLCMQHVEVDPPSPMKTCQLACWLAFDVGDPAYRSALMANFMRGDALAAVDSDGDNRAFALCMQNSIRNIQGLSSIPGENLLLPMMGGYVGAVCANACMAALGAERLSDAEDAKVQAIVNMCNIGVSHAMRFIQEDPLSSIENVKAKLVLPIVYMCMKAFSQGLGGDLTQESDSAMELFNIPPDAEGVVLPARDEISNFASGFDNWDEENAGSNPLSVAVTEFATRSMDAVRGTSAAYPAPSATGRKGGGKFKKVQANLI